jgi:MFS family permease
MTISAVTENSALTVNAADEASPGLLTMVGRYPDLRRLMGSLAVSQVGDWAYNVGLLVTVYDLSHSGSLLAATTVARILPEVLAGPLGGVLADRYDRRRVMIISDLARAALMILFAACLLLKLPLAWFPVLAGLSSLAAAPYRTCVGATIPRTVPTRFLPTANSARSVVAEASAGLGPILQAGLVLSHAAAATFLLNALSFFIAAGALTRMSRDCFAPTNSSEERGLFRDLRAGVTALRAYPKTWPVAGADILGSGIYGLLMILLLLFSRAVTGGDAGYGLLLTASGLGGVIGAALTTRTMARLPAHRLLVMGLLLIAAPLLALAIVTDGHWFFVALTAVAVHAAASVMVEIQADTILQESIPEEVFGRAYGFVVPACYGVQALVAGLAPAICTMLGLRGAFLAGAGTTLAYLGWVVLTRRARATDRRSPRHRADKNTHAYTQ